MKAEKPLIVVTGPNKRLKFGWWATRFMLFLAGARGHYVSTATPGIPDEAQGVVIGGGDDIDPLHYGLMGDGGATYDPDRDALEMQMVRYALACDVPLLGICRGAQLINVVLGGSLFIDIRPLRRITPNRNTLFPIKWANLVQQSRLASILSTNPVKINSLHNQAIDRVAEGLKVAARDQDEFVQAVESTGTRFIVGVQWHPEYLPYHASQRRLFADFIAAAKSCDNELGCRHQVCESQSQC